jgi:hypothetical protein
MNYLTLPLKHFSKESIMNPLLHSHFGNPVLHPDKVSIVFKPEPYEIEYLLSEFPNRPGYRDNTYNYQEIYNHLIYAKVNAVGSRPSDIRIEIYPSGKFKRAAFLRAEWNPSTADMSKVMAIFDSLLQYGYNRLIVNGTFTRFDLACDIPSFNMHNFLYYRPRTKCKRPANEKFYGTRYVGSSQSKIQFCIYDKNWEQFIQHGISPRYSHLTRIEARLLKRRLTIDNLKSELIKTFKSLFITPYSPDGTPGDWQSFLDKCHVDGVSYSLKALTQHHRNKSIKRLSSASLSGLLGDRLSIGIDEVVNSIFSPVINQL